MNYRRDNYWAFVVHRVSGILLTLFLPFHFYVLSLAVQADAFDRFVRWTDQPLVKAAEIALVLLLAAHFTGGLRVLVLEFVPWRESQKTFLAVASGAAMAFGLAYGLALL